MLCCHHILLRNVQNRKVCSEAALTGGRKYKARGAVEAKRGTLRTYGPMPNLFLSSGANAMTSNGLGIVDGVSAATACFAAAFALDGERARLLALALLAELPETESDRPRARPMTCTK